MKNVLKIISLITLSISLGSCASYYLKKANKEYENMNYQPAIEHYNNVLKRKKVNHAVINLAHSYYYTNAVKNAKVYFADAVELPESSVKEYLNYAKVLMQHENYDEAKIWLRKVIEINRDDVVAKMLYASCNSVSEFYRDTTLFELKQFEADEEFNSAFGTTVWNGGVVFTADKAVRLDSRTSAWTGSSYLDLYFSKKDENGKWIRPELLKGDINGKYHEGPAVFTRDGQTVYFTRNNYVKNKLKKNAVDESNLKLYKGKLDGDKWVDIEEMPFNDEDYSVGHPTLSADEKTLYFISDMPGGFGGTDVWSSTYDGEMWSDPRNLGTAINSPGNEMFPYYHQDGSLYFSSDAHNTMGGLDVFITSKVDERWLVPENLNYPLNSNRDDFGFVLQQNDSTGFVSSNRGEDGRDKMYQFVKKQPKFMALGSVANRETGEPLADALVLIGVSGEDIVEQVVSDREGKFKFRMKPGKDYKFLAQKEGYFSVSEHLSTKGKKYSENLDISLALTELVLQKAIVIENIYYDFDKSIIREDAKPALDILVKILNDNPNIVVELSSHTDSRASDRYNLILSDKRARAAVDYIVSKSVDSERINAVGHGEKYLVNECGNGINCTDEKHEENRRTEFKVTEIRSNPVSQE